MTRHVGPIETALQRLVEAYVLEHGHGSATTLGKGIGRSGKWISAFIAGNRTLTVDDGERLAQMLGVELRTLAKAPTRLPRLHATDRRETMMRRLFARLEDNDSKRVVISTIQALLRLQAKRGHDSPAAPADRRRA